MKKNFKIVLLLFAASLAAILVLAGVSIYRIKAFNSKKHTVVFSGENLFTAENAEDFPVSVTANARSDTWTKLFDLNNEGLTENNYQAYTYDFNVSNNTKDEVSSFSFKFTFDNEALMASAWNGAIEFHQNVGGNEIVETVPDLRVYTAEGSKLETIDAEERDLVRMRKGDYFIYYPSSSANALEMPINPNEGTVPGCILYVLIGENIENSTLEIEYTFHRVITADGLFRLSVALFGLWFFGVVIYVVLFAQSVKYEKRHEHDNEIINESIETFTGFIDAKDPYTNGHSKRVAIYTRLLAKELGFSGEVLDRIYYIALLHDCGKIGVPDSILGKPGKLTPEEFEVIKTHTTRGGEILHSFNSIKHVGEGALYHHERYDGNGYPEGRKGEDIPYIARIICVADSFDAMNTDRVYRPRLKREQIVSELEKNKGKQFDPAIADIMLRLIADNVVPVTD